MDPMGNFLHQRNCSEVTNASVIQRMIYEARKEIIIPDGFILFEDLIPNPAMATSYINAVP